MNIFKKKLVSMVASIEILLTGRSPLKEALQKIDRINATNSTDSQKCLVIMDKPIEQPKTNDLQTEKKMSINYRE